MKRFSLAAPLFFLTALVGGATLSNPADAQEVRLRIRLTGPAIAGERPNGHVEYRAKTNGDTKFTAEAGNVNLPDGTQLSVNINGLSVVTLTLQLGTDEVELESENGDTVPVLREGDVVTVTDANGAVILSAQPAPSANVMLQATLSGPAINGLTPKGKARFRSRRGKLDFTAQVERVRLDDGTSLNVHVNGAQIGSLTINLRRGKIELESERGDIVPVMQKGDVVTITNSNGDVLLSGTF